jgi:hypothetical protein
VGEPWVHPLQEELGFQLGASLRPAGQEADRRLPDLNRGPLGHEAEDLRERRRLLLGIVGAEMQLAEAERFLALEQRIEPVARWVHLQPEAAVGRHERAAAPMVLYAKLELDRAVDRRYEVVLVEREPEMVEPGEIPLSGLHDDVDAPALELREAQLEAGPIELLPRDARLVRPQVLGNPPVAPDEVEAELAEVPRFDLSHLARDEVVVEEVHGGRF